MNNNTTSVSPSVTPSYSPGVSGEGEEESGSGVALFTMMLLCILLASIIYMRRRQQARLVALRVGELHQDEVALYSMEENPPRRTQKRASSE